MPKYIDYSAMRRAGKLTGTIKAAKAKAKIRAERSADPNPVKRWHELPLGFCDESDVGRWAIDKYPRRERWITGVSPTTKKIPGGFDVQTIIAGRYQSEISRFTRFDYQRRATSYARGFGSRIVARVFDTTYRWRAPKGWRFGTDDLGVYIVRNEETRERFRYHLDSNSVRSGVAAMRKAGIDHEIIVREAISSERKVKRARAESQKLFDIYGLYVTAADSDAAGNCRSGTMTWGREHDLKAGKHYRAEVIERLAGTHPSVMRVIEQARIRTIAELGSGVCWIPDTAECGGDGSPPIPGRHKLTAP